jgi:hypothetical protein
MTTDKYTDVLYRIKRGLAGYVSYLAACEMNESFSEYSLYEPILRILIARQHKVLSEVECPNLPYDGSGDKKRLDFVVDDNFALEVKWARTPTINIDGDHEKLNVYAVNGKLGFLCVFGVRSRISNLKFSKSKYFKQDIGTPASEFFEERGKAVYAEFGKTRYGCRIYQFKRPNQVNAVKVAL